MQINDEFRNTRLKITEIFHSIQGESSLAGERFSFIRLTGCPLRCTYCDTTYSYTGGKWMTVEEIISEVSQHQTKWILVTGGEPLVQKNCIQLVKALAALGKHISIETDGEENVSEYAQYAKIILDIKTPGSGEKAEFCFENLKYLTTKDEIKFVICNRSDYNWAKEICEKYSLTERFTVLFSSANTVEQGPGKEFVQAISLKDLADWIIEDKLNVRFQTQLHKHIWGANTKGV